MKTQLVVVLSSLKQAFSLRSVFSSGALTRKQGSTFVRRQSQGGGRGFLSSFSSALRSLGEGGIRKYFLFYRMSEL
jgi:hypothetical protein